MNRRASSAFLNSRTSLFIAVASAGEIARALRHLRFGLRYRAAN